VAGSVLLGAGVGLVLTAKLGSDGYSTLLAGLADSTGLPYAVVNWTIGAVLVGTAWRFGQTPGVGTIVQPLIVGFVVNAILDTVDTPHALVWRAVMLAAAATLMAIGVATYLSTELGAGPVEAAARAFDPPVPFRWSYGIVQGGGALAGWRLGAPIGVGTLIVVFGLGPAVHLLMKRGSPAAQRMPIEPWQPPSTLPDPGR